MRGGGISCPVCGDITSRVVDKRDKINRIWRRRECGNGHRFNTAEVYNGRARMHFDLKRLEALRQKGLSYKDIAAKYKVSIATIWKAHNGI